MTDFETHPVGTADRIKALEAENEALRRIAEHLLEQNEGCAVHHYGEDFQLFGMPQYLVEARATLAAITEPPK